MSLSGHLRAWANHFALNLGSAVACLFYAALPPQMTGHSPHTIKSLSQAGFFGSLRRGLFD